MVKIISGKVFIKICLSLLLKFLIIQLAIADSFKSSKTEYDITVRIDPANRTIQGKSIITVDNSREVILLLGKDYEVTKANLNDLTLATAREYTDKWYSWRIPLDFNRQHRFEIHWQGKLAHLDTSLDHPQTLGRPIAVSSEIGTFLPDASGWYPHIAGGMATYKVTIELPSGQKGLVAGQLVKEIESEQEYKASFEFPFPAEGIDLMAGPFVVETQTYKNIKNRTVQLRTYFHPQINNLAQDYLESVKRYLGMYEVQVGEYPYTEFSIVSSPTPTGFGMPTLTYLGISVLQLPFIRNTSLGHEILHNWWGNGVYPDYRLGNWSEGLTTFMADYAYKEQESEEAAREMRIGWLRDFMSLQAGQDEPLNAFTSRTHNASKIVGYNKSAMLFFMLRDYLGEAVFYRAIQEIWNTQQFKVTSWQHLQQIFELVSEQNLLSFFNQWLERSGAPSITIIKAESNLAESDHELSITLEQSTPIYQLRVPVVIQSQGRTKTEWLDLQREQQTFMLTLNDKPLSVSLDPDLRLFRLLAPKEAPPILREVMVNPTTETIILAPKGGEVSKIAEILASTLQQRPPKIIPVNRTLSAAPTLIIGLMPEIDAWIMAKNLSPRPSEINNKGTAQAWTMTRADGASLALISAKDATSLEALIRPLPHYGRQSYIVFDNRQAIERGIWPMQVQKIVVK